MVGEKGWVYCAGPLFNAVERHEMEVLSNALEKAGFKTFLPQRDGLELTRCAEFLMKEEGFTQTDAAVAVSRAIFALDVYQVVEHCQAVVVNLNGRVPDEGTVSEAAMAWCAGKALVGYKADGRSVFLGQDNPLVAGLFDFELCSSTEEVVSSVEQKTAKRGSASRTLARRRTELASYLQLGRQIWTTLNTGHDVHDVAAVLSRLRGMTSVGGVASPGT